MPPVPQPSGGWWLSIFSVPFKKMCMNCMLIVSAPSLPRIRRWLPAPPMNESTSSLCSMPFQNMFMNCILIVSALLLFLSIYACPPDANGLRYPLPPVSKDFPRHPTVRPKGWEKTTLIPSKISVNFAFFSDFLLNL